MDLLLRAITADTTLRVLAAVTTDLVVEACRRHELRGVEAVALGRALTAGCMLTTLTKSTGERLRVDMRTDGALGGLLLDARGDGSVRGCMRRSLGDHPLRRLIEASPGRLPLAPLMGTRGVLSVTRDLGLENTYQGHVDAPVGEVDGDLEHYLNTSEQIPSLLHCDVVLDGAGGVLRSAGLLCQTFPGGDPEVLAPLRQRLAHGGLTSLLHQPRAPHELVGFILDGEDFIDMGSQPLAFRCHCDPSVARGVVATLGAEDIEALATEREETEVRCAFCGERYILRPPDLRALAAELRSTRS